MRFKNPSLKILSLYPTRSQDCSRKEQHLLVCSSLGKMRDTESQCGNGWKGPLEIILATAPVKGGFLDQIAQECIQVAFESL